MKSLFRISAWLVALGMAWSACAMGLGYLTFRGSVDVPEALLIPADAGIIGGPILAMCGLALAFVGHVWHRQGRREAA